MKTKSPKRWYVVGDSGRAIGYLRRVEGATYERVAEWTSEMVLPADQRPHFADKPGRHFDSLGGQRHSTETTTPADLAKQAFGRTLAQALNKAHADGAFEQLLIFAAPKLLHELRTHLDKGTASAVVHGEAKNITKLPEQELFAVLDSAAVAASRTKSRTGVSSRG